MNKEGKIALLATIALAVLYLLFMVLKTNNIINFGCV